MIQLIVLINSLFKNLACPICDKFNSRVDNLRTTCRNVFFSLFIPEINYQIIS